MILQNSYIFLKNSFARNTSMTVPSVTTLRLSMRKYIRDAFQNITKDSDYGNFYKTKYATTIQYNNISYSTTFLLTEVTDKTYLDVVVEGKNKAQIVSVLEHIQYKLFATNFRENYIDIISYDSVSEYYCNKLYPKLNLLERNLRKLLLNVYTVNFGLDYFTSTISKDLQDKIKGSINASASKDVTNGIKKQYYLQSRTESEYIQRLQNFFYSFEYGDIQKLLFTPNWTKIDETEKENFLKSNSNLSELSDEELRTAFLNYVPKSDWDRFFRNKINLNNIEQLIEELRTYRNSIAHCKFFYKGNYIKANQLINTLNLAIIKAIQITEDKDFESKNSEALSEALKSISNLFCSLKNEITQNITSAFTTQLLPKISIGDMISKEIKSPLSELKQHLITPLLDIKNNSIPKLKEILDDSPDHQVSDDDENKSNKS